MSTKTDDTTAADPLVDAMADAMQEMGELAAWLPQDKDFRIAADGLGPAGFATWLQANSGRMLANFRAARAVEAVKGRLAEVERLVGELNDSKCLQAVSDDLEELIARLESWEDCYGK